jgi:two-component system CheB/CheR fusion protein
MTLRDGVLHLTQRSSDHSQHTPIDTFFTSLAEYAQSRAIGVILSGTASDGVVGVKAIKAAAGITIAQRPDSAKFEGMPRAAIATDVIDLVLSPAEIAGELLRIARHPFLRPTLPVRDAHEPLAHEGQLGRVFQLLRKSTGVDFTCYKPPTILRRIHRRMMLHKIGDFGHYLKYLEENPSEVENLYQDILIHVTRFFREPDSFEALKMIVFPKIFAHRKPETPIRVWVPGCSTGEEPYSVAITLVEYLSERALSTPIQIFATDLSEAAIERARAAIYPKSIMADVSAERLRRFFQETGGSYQISKAVRDLCVFARQDLTRDPPFSKLDLIVCRNVLIYLGPVLQKRLMNMFHYAIKPHGFLMLGHAETVGVHADLFSVTDKRHRVYSRKTVELSPAHTIPIDYKVPRHEESKASYAERPSATNVHSEATRVLLEKYTPPGVIVDSTLQILQFRGATGAFLEPAPGDASLHLLTMAREGLIFGLRSGLRAARKSNGSVRRDGLRVKQNGRSIDVSVDVIPLGAAGDDRHYLILFHEASSKTNSDSPPAKRHAAKKSKATDQTAHMAELSRLEQELAASREYLQSVIQDMEAANEELQSANEEIMSSNEELQSTNEELDTAKEELQSTNEELNTLNEELQGRNEELSHVNSDLVNLLASVHIAIVMVSGDLRIRRFTPMAEKTFNLISSDLGRPVGHIQPNIDGPDLERLINEVMDTMTVTQHEVRDRDGRWYWLRVRPYKNLDNKIDGAVLALFESDKAKRNQEQSDDATAFAKRILDAIPEPALLLDRSLRITTMNRAYAETFDGTDDAEPGTPLDEFHDGLWNEPPLRAALELAFSGTDGQAEFETTHNIEGIGRRAIKLRAGRFTDGDGEELVLATLRVAEK